MSYILDALKKAESERNLGGVPSLHAAAANNAQHAGERSQWRRSLPWLLVLLMAGILLLALLWLRPWSKPTAEPATTPTPARPGENVASVAPKVVAQEQATPVVQSPAQPAAQPVLRPAASAPSAAKPAAAAPVAVTSKTGNPTEQVAEKHHTDTAQAGQGQAVTATPAQAPLSSQPQDAARLEEETVGPIQDLPTNIQRELPQVSVNGYIYAKNPLDRSVLINKRLLHEGDTIAPDLVLEKMTPKGAILNFKGYRYRISF